MLRLALVGAVVTFGGSVVQMAWAHTLTIIVGSVMYVLLVARCLRQHDLLRRPALNRTVRRDLVRYAQSQYSSDLVLMLRGASLPSIVSAWGGAASMATYAATLSLARLNEVVMEAFAALFTPTAARLKAAQQRSELRVYYWRTIAWIAVGGFPMFAMTVLFPEQIIVFLLEERYASSASVLALIALGLYAHACFGFNERLLRLENRGDLAVRSDIAAFLVEVVAALMLVPAFGAVGAGAAVLTASIFHWRAQVLAAGPGVRSRR